MKSFLRRMFGMRSGTRGGDATERERLTQAIRPRREELSPEGLRRLIAACRDLGDGDPCGPEVYRLLEEEMSARRTATGTEFGPANPQVSHLIVKRSGLPDWWNAGGNLLLAGADIAAEASIRTGFLLPPPTESVAVIGAGAIAGEWVLAGQGSLFVLGDQAKLLIAKTTVRAGSTIIIGEGANAISPAYAIAMNGGIVVVGADALWAGGIVIMTDDFHAIRDRFTDKRINTFGGRVIIDRHVWLGLGANILGDCYVGHDGVVGIGSMVKNVALPPFCISAGRPARVVRRDIIWSLDDLP